MQHTTPFASFPKTALLASLLLVTILGGCVDDGQDDCIDGVCTQTAKPGDAFLTNATRPMADFPDCTGAVLVADVARANLEGHIPAAFTLGGQTGATATLIIDVFDCDRVAVENQTGESLRMVKTMVFARPLNESWGPRVVGHYAFEIFVNDPEVGQRLRTWGLPAFDAEIEKTVVSAGPLTRAEWTVAAEDRSYAFPITEVEGQGGGSSPQTALWAGHDEIRRVDRNLTYRATTGGIGIEPVTMDGRAVYQTITGTQVHGFRTQPYDVLEDAWRLYPFSFSP